MEIFEISKLSHIRNVFISVNAYESITFRMFNVMFSRFNFFTRRIAGDTKRFFLSNAYKCEEVWANRLKNPIFQKLDSSVLYQELDLSFQKNERVNVLDIDLLCNSLKDSNFKSELDDILLKIRLCPECIILPERATHAAIRWYMLYTSTDELLNVLGDRINYGLFPDYYLTNLLMDKYLNEKDSRSAVKIAVLQMLQEDFANPITKVLALHCCYNYLESPEIWPSYKEPEPDPDEEVQKIRVAFLRNPYFDDHFDIRDTNHLVGKTLWLFGRTVSEPLGTSSQLVGLVLYEKHSKCVEFLEEVIQKGIKLHAEAVEKAREFSLKKPKQFEEKDESESEKVVGDQADSKGGIQAESVDESKIKTLELLEKINEANLIKGSLLSESAEAVKQMLQVHESAEIERQCQIYKQWEKDRTDHIQLEIERSERNKVKSEIEETKKRLMMEEEKLFFFDREEEISMLAEEKSKIRESLIVYKVKGSKKEKFSDSYIPPDVKKKPN